MKKNQFDYNDFLASTQQMKNMGGLSGLMSMLPGLGGMGNKNLKLSDEQMADIGDIIEQGTSLEMTVRVPGGEDESGTFYISKVSATMLKLADDSWWELSFNAIEE